MNASFLNVIDVVDAQIPALVWHYTSLEGFTGIIKSKKIWATEIRYLNDKSEFVHATHLLRRVIEEISNQEEADKSAKRLLISLLDDAESAGALSQTVQNLFVASFSTHGDQLSQWRGYGAGGRGVSLGFDLKDIRPPATADSAFAFGPCLYRNEDKSHLIRSAVDSLRNAFSIWARISIAKFQESVNEGLNIEEATGLFMAAENRKELSFASKLFITDVFRLTPFLKHSSFEEEAEWRIVAPLSASKPVKYVERFMRHGRSMLLPTVAVSLGREGELPLRKVVVGPAPEPKLAADSIRLYLKWHELDQVEVSSSEVPFRSW